MRFHIGDLIVDGRKAWTIDDIQGDACRMFHGRETKLIPMKDLNEHLANGDIEHFPAHQGAPSTDKVKE